MKKIKPRLPTIQESLASISQSLREIADSLQDSRGESALVSMTEALFDLAEYGPGKLPKKYYDWRHPDRG
jgi:hypothetical protein